MNAIDPKDPILSRLAQKSVCKQEVYKNTLDAFKTFKSAAKEITKETKSKIADVHPNIQVEFSDKGEFNFEMKFAGDMLVAYMHSNVFEFPRENAIHKTAYVKKDPLRSFCGSISFYNFLSDSFKYNRQNDIGYLVARFFINKEKHFFVEGKRQMGFLYNNFATEQIDKTAIRKILETAIVYCIDFDLLTPPYDHIKEVTVLEFQERTARSQLRTGKRLGFRFQADENEVI